MVPDGSDGDESDAPIVEGDRVPATRPWALPIEIVSYALAIALVCSPGILHLRTHIFGAGDDARYYTWLGWAIGKQVSHWHILPAHVPGAISPFGLDLRLIDGYLPSYINGLFNLVAGPIVAYNLTFVLGAVLNIVAARALGQRLSRRRAVHVLVAVAFLTAPPIALNVQLGLLPLFWAFTVPLLVADALDVVTGARGVRVLRLTLLLVAAYLCSVYFLVFGAVAYGLIVLVAAARQRSFAVPLRVVAAGLATVVLLSPIILTRLHFDSAEQQHGGNNLLLADSKLFSADLLSIVAQPTRSTFLLPRPDALDEALSRLPDPTYALEYTIFPGLLLLTGFVGFLFVRDRRRLPLVATVVSLWVLALGPSLKVAGKFVWTRQGGGVSELPYRALLAFPALGALRAPNRIGSILVVVLLAATGIALDRAMRTRDRRRYSAVVGVSTVLLATNLLVPVATTTLGTSHSMEGALREVARRARPGDTVLSVPSDCNPTFISYQLLHHTPVLGCAGSFAANPWRTKLVRYTQSLAFTKLRCDRELYGRIPTTARPLPPFGQQDVNELRTQFGVRFLVIDQIKLRSDCVAGAVLPFLEQFPSLGGDREYAVIDLAPKPPRRT